MNQTNAFKKAQEWMGKNCICVIDRMQDENFHFSLWKNTETEMFTCIRTFQLGKKLEISIGITEKNQDNMLCELFKMAVKR